MATKKDRCCILKEEVKRLINQTEGLNLVAQKRDSICDGVACTPKTFQSALSSDSIRDGVFASGMIDKGSESAPDLTKILNTRRQTLTKEEYERVLANFHDLYHVAVQNGHISDNELLSRGFPVDLDMNGEERHRDAGISQEPYQRAKCLSHQAQIKLRNQGHDEARLKQLEKISAVNAKNQSMLQCSKQCEGKVIKEMGENHHSSCGIGGGVDNSGNNGDCSGVNIGNGIGRHRQRHQQWHR